MRVAGQGYMFSLNGKWEEGKGKAITYLLTYSIPPREG
jgi:hypothetical protein